VNSSGWVGIGTASPTSKLHVVGDGKLTSNLSVGGTIQLNTLGTAGGSQLCRNASNQIAASSFQLALQDKHRAVFVRLESRATFASDSI